MDPFLQHAHPSHKAVSNGDDHLPMITELQERERGSEAEVVKGDDDSVGAV
jgi:hypothetical protein